MSRQQPEWRPQDGDRVRVVSSGQVGTVAHQTLTEWGWICDVVYDATSERRSHTVPELEPLDAASS